MKKKRTICKLLLIYLILSFLIGAFSIQVLAADLGTLTYWDANTNEINRWTYSWVMVQCVKLNSNGAFYFNTGMDHAVSEWSSVGLTTIRYEFTSTPYIVSTDVIMWGGTATELNKVVALQNEGLVPVSATITGIAYPTDKVSEGTWNHTSGSKTGYKLLKIRGYIVDKDRTSNEYKNTCTHELGHALGWCGHTSNSSSVMYAEASSITALTNIDKRHLQQVYN